MSTNSDTAHVPKLSAMSNTRYSITLTWKSCLDDKSVYKLQLKDRLWGWITKYWGFKTQAKVDNLGPEECYYFRVGVSKFKQNEYSWSEVIPAITKDDHTSVINLHRAVQYGNINVAKKFLANRPNAIDNYDRKGKSALVKAAMKGDTQLMGVLVAAGASVDLASRHSQVTALMEAAWRGQLDCARLLVDSGAHWNATDNHGCSAVHYAVDNSQINILKMAIEMGADINLKDANGWSPLMRGVLLNSKTEVLEELLKNGADVNATDKRGQSALMQAILALNTDGVRMLLKSGASTGLSNMYNNTAIDMAGLLQDKELETILKTRQEQQIPVLMC
ncbi:fibronectin type 3 and ankyrin repeat domains protein 1 [Nilaparvata lugens]|uniref:fibronectin type 3 and ankyrin repeat domains protein 1 n=1 Tax=Nilaparvata lugens TaxID=108931 RepID=UPI00193D93C9|nr:fibronectin type 3 and ankyrin repeat domains protein 1 [Nilaparvata lugens]